MTDPQWALALSDLAARVADWASRIEAERLRLAEQGCNIKAVARELPRLAMPRIEALREGGVPGSLDERERVVFGIFLQTFRDMQNDPQRTTEFREAAGVLAERWRNVMDERLGPSPAAE